MFFGQPSATNPTVSGFVLVLAVIGG